MRRLLTQSNDIPTLRSWFASDVIREWRSWRITRQNTEFRRGCPVFTQAADAHGAPPYQKRWMIPTPAANRLGDEEGADWKPSPSVAVALMMLDAPGVPSVLPFARWKACSAYRPVRLDSE